MDDQHYKENITVQYCLPENDASCIRASVHGLGYLVLCFIISCVSVCTVVLNLLVIISISHFKQLHTPTNLIILSLAVADLLIGLVNMPVLLSGLMDTCWYLGPLLCYIIQIICFLSKYGSLYSVILIAVDRFIAITNPLQYSSKFTFHKTMLAIILGWSICLCYVIIYLYTNDSLTESNSYSQCYGECTVYAYFYWFLIDFVVVILVPCSFILILYSVVFKVAIHQARAIRAVKNCASNNHGAKTSRASEIKAAKKLGTVVFVYLTCWMPFYISTVSVRIPFVVLTVFSWLIDINSFVNPLLYAIFYSWFRTSAKYIVTGRIFKSSFSRLNFFFLNINFRLISSDRAEATKHFTALINDLYKFPKPW